jgi:hypothetical protein
MFVNPDYLTYGLPMMISEGLLYSYCTDSTPYSKYDVM